MAAKREPYKILDAEDDDDFDFLPPKNDADFVLICTDRASPGGPYCAFGLRAADLRKASAVFEEMLSVKEAQMWLNAPPNHRAVASLLSAAFEPSHSYLLDPGGWNELLDALSLARRWQFRAARGPLLQVMLCMMPTLKDELTEGLKITDFLCEAAVQGDIALVHATTLLRLRRSIGRPAIKTTPMPFADDYFVELGPSGISKVAQATFILARDGVLK